MKHKNDFESVINNEYSRMDSMEEALGLGLMMPFNNTNSSPRKLMHGVEIQQALQLLDPEPPMLSTGYENRAGEFSSSLVKTKNANKVIAKISKFSFLPDQHYYLIVQDIKTGIYDVIERIEYKYISEEYGVLFNNKYLDSLKPGMTIPRGSTIKKSLSFDEEYNNRQDGRNLLCLLGCNEHIKEDGIKISDVAAIKLAAPLIKDVSVVKNDNHIMLNLYGNDKNYKVIPDIGEYVKDNNLCALRTRKKEDSLFSESYYRLSKKMMSDDKYLASGKVIDIDIYCNNPDAFESYTDSQLKMYYDESIRCGKEIVEATQDIVENCKATYNLQKLYYNNNKIINGGQYIKDKKFSNMIIKIVLMEEIPVKTGDKLSNRYGGKGCVSEIVPQNQMPQLENGEYVDIEMDASGPYNREIMGALLELSVNFAGQRLVDYYNSGVYDKEDILKAYMIFIKEICPNIFKEFRKYMHEWDADDISSFIDSIVSDKGIKLSLKPISESLTIDDLNNVYQKLEEAGFPIKQYSVTVPQKDSMGNIRYIPARRKLTIGYQYVYRLKQHAKDKFSVTSLASINIKNENSKSSSKKYYKSLYPHTPTRFGNMESGDLGHIGSEDLIVNLMLVSSSPHGRRLSEKLLVDNPFNVDIRLDNEATNTGAEILNAYLLTQGLKLEFIKIPKKRIPLFVESDENDKLKVPLFEKFDKSDKCRDVYFHIDPSINNGKDLIPLFEAFNKYDKCREEYYKSNNEIKDDMTPLFINVKPISKEEKDEKED